MSKTITLLQLLLNFQVLLIKQLMMKVGELEMLLYITYLYQNVVLEVFISLMEIKNVAKENY